MKVILIIFACLSVVFSINGQVIGGEPVEENKISPWIVEDAEKYEGIYSFGFSEMEWTLIVLIEKDMICAQSVSGYFDGLNSWKWEYNNYPEVLINGNKFHYSNKTRGEFVKYLDGNETKHGLLLYSIMNDEVDYNRSEIGPKSSVKIEKYFAGLYPEATYRLLGEDDLKNFTKEQLRIMRNEIFARYGYKFREGGEMMKYFSAAKWYSPSNSDVNRFLTEIEKKNISLIKEFETK